MKKLFIMTAILFLIPACATVPDEVINQADTICNATTTTKDDYRSCMADQYQKIKDGVAATVNTVKQVIQ